MTKLERIQQRGKEAAERSGSQSDSWERERERAGVRQEFRRVVRNELGGVGMGFMWWKD